MDLLDAARSGDIQSVRELLDRGADPNIRNNDGWTALDIASEYGHTDIVELLEDIDPFDELSDPDIDLLLAKDELTSSPLYENLLISSDAKHTAIIINFKRDKKYQDLFTRKNLLYEKEFSNEISAQEELGLQKILQEF